jgi:parallel beta-helix repeat protein
MKSRRALGAFAVTTALVSGVGATEMAGAADVVCGQTINQNTTLTHDIGPCPNNGLVIGANNITLNLNGHRIFGLAGDDDDGTGVLLVGRSGVTVTGGTVQFFDVGIIIEGGNGNTVDNMDIRDNIGRATFFPPGTPAPPPIPGTRGGDGIAIESSRSNRIINNLVRNNGPFSGIGLYTLIDSDHPRTTSGPSSGNYIDSNIVEDNVVGRASLGGTDNDGIRVENNSSQNFILRNTVRRNGLDGIALFANTTFNNVQYNIVQGNGFFRTSVRRGSGIILFNGSNGNFVHGNTVVGNADNGIVAQGPLTNALTGAVTLGANGNRIVNNTATGNARTPALPTTAPAFVGPRFDLHDRNPNCDNNQWWGNRYNTAFPPCTTAGGQQLPAG